MPKPREVFDDPDKFWSLLTAPTDDQFENQHFDRKEAGRVGPSGNVNVRDIIAEVRTCISAFANANLNGGLLVLGIASDGSIKGINHLNEGQLNNITNFGTFLINQAAEVNFHDCTDETGSANRILLIYIPYVERAICEGPGRNPEGWCRSGPQNVPLTQASRDRLRYRKQIVDFENTYCCDFNIGDVDKGVLTAFRQI